MTLASDVLALQTLLERWWTTRYAERLNPAGAVTITITPPDVKDMGYADVPCPPGRLDLATALLIQAASADTSAALDLLDVLEAVALVVYDAGRGWLPVSAEAVDVEDRPGYLLTITRRASQ